VSKIRSQESGFRAQGKEARFARILLTREHARPARHLSPAPGPRPLAPFLYRFLRISALTVFALTAAFAQPGQPAPAQPSYSLQDGNLKTALPGALQGVGIDQRLNAQVPLDLTFRDEAGRDVPLSSFFRPQKPVILALVYYRCPMLCTQILNGVESSLKAVSLDPGRDFEVLSVSFDPKDTSELAASKKQMYLRRYGRPNTANGWHFLSGDEPNIKALADSVGFHYKYDPKTDQYAHASGIMILTPDGHISKYFYGVEYAARDLRLGLVEASQDKIGNPVDQILLFCYHYDPATGKYGAMTMNILRAFAAGFTLLCGAFMLIAFRRDSRRSRRSSATLDHSR
jgi:protein SCO1